MKTSLTIWGVLLFLSCQGQPAVKTNLYKNSRGAKVMVRLDSVGQRVKQAMNADNYMVDCKSVKQDFTVIQMNCGIFISPDSVELIPLKKEYGDEDLKDIVDENNSDIKAASRFLDSMHYKSLYPTTRYLKFKINNTFKCFDTKSSYRIDWLSVLYKTNSKLKIFQSGDIEKVFKGYAREK